MPTMGALQPVIAHAFGRELPAAREAIRQLRIAREIPGVGRRGPKAPNATAEDVAMVAVAFLSGDRPYDAPLDFARSSELVSDDETRGLLLELVEAAITTIATEGCIPGVEQLVIAIARPWPRGKVVIDHGDGRVSVTEFVHPDASGTGDPIRDKLKLAALEERWGHRGFTTWSEITLPPLTAIANALAGRGDAKERYRREPPKLQLRQGLWQPWLEATR